MRHERLVKGICFCDERQLCVSLSDDCKLMVQMTNENECLYSIKYHNKENSINMDLRFIVNSAHVSRDTYFREYSFGYANYCFPTMMVSGTVTVDGEEMQVEGVGSHDRLFSSDALSGNHGNAFFWSHFSLRLSPTCALSVYRRGGESVLMEEETIAFLSEGEQTLCFMNSDIEVAFDNSWMSFATFISYPSVCLVNIRAADLSCSFNPSFNGQEFVTSFDAGFGMLMGSVKGTGMWRGEHIAVKGFGEYKCPIPYNNVEGLLRTVSKVTKKTLCELYPLDADAAWITANVTGQYTLPRGTPPEKVCETLFKPVRCLIERNGKAWRSLVLALCCNMLSSQHFDCTRYIAMTELLHLGSLVIDDIQDNSTVRRRGPCVHVEVGVPAAINAGTACYFMGPQLARIHELNAEKSSRIYQLYFDVLRTGHAGQGLDLHGVDYLMPEAVRTGNSIPLKEALQAIHMYKTGAAAGGVCRIACTLCDANDEVTLALERFGTRLGLAFQIVDDALDLCNSAAKGKDFAEDIKSGKITYPVAIAMGHLGSEQRERLWILLHTEVKDDNTLKCIIDLLSHTNAVAKCFEESRLLVKDAWDSVSPHLSESFPKALMRVFCDYLTERTY
ncbi:geranylgeranyl diphosphate synthase, type I [Strigomonas culicis]|nr:geranylgeranyl diphosphate synthase, type I [Strigomonas culicis]|eukprot:EPY19725.1 geranylgeranyl diphosphate synthase, type I [Strigomonas culicis]